MFVFDYAQEESFKNVQKWYNDSKEHKCHRILVGNCRNEETRVIFVLCSVYVADNSQAVSVSDARKLAKEMNFVYQPVNLSDPRSMDELTLAIIGHPVAKIWRTRSAERHATQ